MSLSIRHWLAERNIELSQLVDALPFSGRPPSYNPSEEQGGATAYTTSHAPDGLGGAKTSKPLQGGEGGASSSMGHPSAQIAGIAFRIAQDMEVKSLNAFAISVLTDVLELPLKAAWQAAPAMSHLTLGLLRILSRKKPLKRNEGTWLTFQVAYLNALQGILEQESQLKRPWINRAEVPASSDADQLLSEPQLLAVVKTLRPGRLSDSQAEQALSLVADSFLVQQMNNLAIAWFVANGAEETEAKLLTQRLTHGLAGHLLTVIAENPLPLAQLQKFVRLGNLSSFRDTTTTTNADINPELSTATLPLSLDREYYRAGLLRTLSEPLLAEHFALKDLYVPLKGRPLQSGTRDSVLETWIGQNHSQSSTPTPQSPVDLMGWAMSQLEDKTSIAIIEAELGGGKTSFCQMWASFVARELYPIWMPVMIRLSKVTLGQTLEQTLETAFPIGRFTDTDGWFSLSSPPCLLILDGLDELPRSPQTDRHLWTFMEQVMRFHTQSSGSAGLRRHKIFITSRLRSLDSLIRKYQQSSTLPLPTQLQRIVIEPMGQDEFRQWFQQWAKLQSKSIAQTYFTFLKHGGVFQSSPAAKELATLIHRPLMLYLVGILHRDALLDESIFQMESPQVKFEIYDRMTRWLLGEPAAATGLLPELTREGLAHATRSLEAIANLLEGRRPQDLRHQMQVAALTIFQTGQYQAPQSAIQKRLMSEPTTDVLPQTLPAFFFRVQPPKGLKVGRLKVESLKDNLAFGFSSGVQLANLQPGPSAQPSTVSFPTACIEFTHPSLGEYLAAEEIAAQLQALTRQVQNQYGEVTFVIHNAVNVAQHLYDLLGYGILSTQIEELVVERLRREEKRNAEAFSFPILFKRLYNFYRAYCRGRWLDEGIAHHAHSQLQALHNPVNILQIDAAVGLNVFLLLCSGAREAKIPFCPCGNPEIRREFDADQLLSFISRTAALSPSAFWQRVRYSLSGVQLSEACLNQAMLAEANLSQANLSAAELIGTNLAAANLENANLSWASLAGANLAKANLCGANLEGADLSGANLKGANLKSANLTNACLFQTQMDEEINNFAVRSGAIFSPEEFQVYNQSLVPTRIINNLEDDALLEEEPTIFIESAEGEVMLPDAQYNVDYDVETAQIEYSTLEKSGFSDDEYISNSHEDTARLDDFANDDINY